MTDDKKVMALILAPKPTNYEVWQATGISQATLSRIKSGDIRIENLASWRKEKLLNYYYKKENIIND